MLRNPRFQTAVDRGFKSSLARMLKAIIFDLDGVLVDTMQFIMAAYREGLASVGVTATDEEIRNNAYDHPIEEIAKRFGIKDVTKFGIATRNAFNKYDKQGNLFPGALETLELMKNIPKAIGTSRPRPSTLFLDHLDIYKYFKAFITSSDVTYTKPHPEIFQTAANELGVTADEIIIVGDTPNDINAAKAMGSKCILFHSNHNLYTLKEMEQLGPDFIVYNHKELQKIFKEQFALDGL